VDCFEKAIALNPKYQNAFFNLAIVYSQLGQDDRAIPAMQQAARLGHKDAQEALQSRGMTW